MRVPCRVCQKSYHRRRGQSHGCCSIRCRLLNKMDKTPGHGPTRNCFLWMGGTGAQGYGHIWVEGKTRDVHQVTYETFVGPIPEGLVVRHTCDVRTCINPDHLVVGTQGDNVQDAVSRHRHPAGERHGRAKLTVNRVAEMRKLYETEEFTQAQLSALYKVSKTQVSRILRGEAWTEDNQPVDQDGRKGAAPAHSGSASSVSFNVGETMTAGTGKGARARTDTGAFGTAGPSFPRTTQPT